MKDSKNTIAEVVKYGLSHSIAQAFLIFSGVLVIASVRQANDYIPVSFFTLFYALIAHYLTALRKHESLGRYAVGSDHLQSIRFTITYISYFVWWTTGVGMFLSTPYIFGGLDKIPSLNTLFPYILIFIGTWIFTRPTVLITLSSAHGTPV